MVLIAGMAHGLNASAVNKGYMVFLLPVSEAFGIGRVGGSIVFSLARAGDGPFGAVAGWLIDRFGPKPIFLIGSTMVGVGFLLLSQSENIFVFSVIYLVLITIGSVLAFSNATSASPCCADIRTFIIFHCSSSSCSDICSLKVFINIPRYLFLYSAH